MSAITSLAFSVPLALAAAEEWGRPALDRARGEGKPILLLVVDRGTSRTVEAPLAEAEASRGFVVVLADRDERPDLAEIYGSALVLLEETGRPEPPFALVLTPDGRPVAGVETAAPPGALGRLAAEFETRRALVEARAGVTTLALREAQAGAPPRGPLRPEVVTRALRGLLETFNPRRGRFGVDGPPPSGALRFLFEEHARTGSEPALRAAIACLAALARGGMPAREKGRAGLAPNALLLEAYVRAYELTGDSAHRESAAAIADWAAGPMRDPGGAFRAGSGEDGPDDRVFAGANGLMIGALSRSGSSLGRAGDLAAARAAAALFAERTAALPRFFREGKEQGSAFLEDYALLAEGLLELSAATDEPRWRARALAFVEAAFARFLDPARGGFFDTDAAHEPAILRLRSGWDGPLPAGNGVMAAVLLRLARATGETRYAEMARGVVASFLADLEQAPRGLETLAAAAGDLLPRLGPAAADPPLPPRVEVGPVAIEARVSPTRVRPGGTVEVRLSLTAGAGWSVVPHGAGGKERVGLTVGVPEGGLGLEAGRYPRGSEPVTLVLRAPADAPPGERRVRFRVGFQACRGGSCRAPDSALLEAVVVVSP